MTLMPETLYSSDASMWKDRMPVSAVDPKMICVRAALYSAQHWLRSRTGPIVYYSVCYFVGVERHA